MAKITIRDGVFETNSSSMHSIVIVKNEEYFTTDEIMSDIYIGERKVFDLWYTDDLRFTRAPFKIINSFEDKWKYCLAALCKKYNDDVYKELERIAFAHIPGLKEVKLATERNSCPKLDDYEGDDRYILNYGKTEEQIEKYLTELEQTLGIECIEYIDTGDKYVWEVPYTGYAEDYGMLKNYLEENNVSIEEFIMSKKYIIFVDGDEYCVTDNLMDSGLINKNYIEKIVG